MKKLILILLCLVAGASGAIYTVGNGGTHSTIQAAITAGAAGDTIQIISTADTAITVTSQCDLKTRMLLRSEPGRIDTIWAAATFDPIHSAGDSTRLYNIVIGWNNTTPVGTHYLRSSESTTSGRGGFVDSNVTYINVGGVSSSKRIYNTNKPATYLYEKAYCVDCKYYDFGASGFNISATDTSLQPITNYTRCKFYNTAVWLPHKSVFEYNAVVFSGQNTFCGGDSSIVRYNYFNAQGNTGSEIVSLDDARRAYSWQFYGNTYDSSGHVKLSIDGAHRTVVYNERFDTTTTATYDIYGHNADQYDTCSDLVIRNIYMKSGFNIATNAAQDWKKFRLKNSIFLGGCDISLGNSVDDTLSKLLWLGTKGTITGDPYQVDTLSGDTNAVINRNHYPFIKQKANNNAIMSGDTIGPLKYLTVYKSLIDTTNNGFSAVCSLSTDFYWNDPVVKDSATIRMYVRTGSNSFVQCDSAININAGQKDTLNFSSGSSGTIYEFKFITTGHASESVVDTTFTYSITTLGSETPAFDSTIYLDYDCDDITHPLVNGFALDNTYTRFDSTVKYRGAASCSTNFIGNDDGNQQCGIDFDQISIGSMCNGSELWTQSKIRFADNFSWGEGSPNYIKFGRISNMPLTNQYWTLLISDNRIFIGETGHLSPIPVDAASINYNFPSLSDGKWHEFTVAYGFESSVSANDGWFKFYLDSVLVDSVGSLNYVAGTDTSGGFVWGGLQLIYGQLNGTSADGGTVWYDDIIATNYTPHMTTFDDLNVTTKSHTTGSRWDAYKSAFKSAYKRAWK